MLVSIVTTTKNAEYYIADLLDSLVSQEPEIEIIVVDAESKDKTQEIVKSYQKKCNFIKLYSLKCKRSFGLNYGAKNAKGEIIAFIGADCIANPFWIKEIKNTLSKSNNYIVYGKSINLGYKPFAELSRVELYHKDVDVSIPGHNTAYKKQVLEKIGYLDENFVTAEDIDLNYRAINAGFKLICNENAIVYHRVRDTVWNFIVQAFWNGYGRKQLTEKHGKLWSKYKVTDMLKRNVSFWYFVRLFFGICGYISCKFGFKKAFSNQKV